MAASVLKLPLPAEGSEKIVVKKTFLEVEEDLTPQGLPASYNSDSVVWARFTRQISSCSDNCEDGQAQLGDEPVQEEEEQDSKDEAEGFDKTLPKLLGNVSMMTVSTDDKDSCSSASDGSPPSATGTRPDLGPAPSEEAVDEATAKAMHAAAAALDAAGISRQSLDHLLNHLSTSVPAPQPVKLLPALPAPGPRAPRTTVMLRNLPNNYTRNMVCTMLDKEGFKGSYDFMYLPIDFRSKANLGYAFINLVDEPKVQLLWQIFDGYTKWVLPSAKVCSVSWSGPHQGQQAHIDRYRDSPIMHGSVPDEFKPAIFAQGRCRSFSFVACQLPIPLLKEPPRAIQKN
ncbi:ML3 [Symbiodinium natans]|uniref:ML3 protein n=1 Tax=Symbiodinium natans TaxID=878477 RepID=A0A812QJK4_9DINO|nr:ML3 [Symbiodinium natans]